ncbi:serine/arginine repetitive matrix protein 2-like [Lagopus muta]|uniref:serine/arginine repetitive matrix protein 2-like n=1 Tax=Lagopus muta TaxID=64668 RepID=UPI00209DEF35|nr:serine/arginine repetitive matrix protein 2-like [Lagopus muta]
MPGRRNSQSKQVEKANSGGPTGTSHKSSPSRKKPSPAPTSEHSRAATEDLGSHPRRPAPRRTCSGHARSTAATAPRQEEKSLAGQATPTALESLSDTLHPPRETANDTQRLANNTGPTTGRAANEASNKTFRSTTRAGNSIKKLTAAARRQKTVKETTATGNSHDPPGIHLPAAKKRKVGELAWRSPGLLSSMKTDPAGGQKLSILAWAGGKANNTHNLLLKRNSQSKQVEKANSGGPTGTSHKSSPSRKKPSPAPTSEHSRAATEDLGSHPRRPAPRRTCSGHARSTAATAPRQEEKSLAGQATPTALESLSDTLHPPRETANDTQRLANNTGPTTGRAANEASNKTFRSTTRAGNSIRKLNAAARRQKTVKETTATGNSHDPPGIHLPAAKKRKVGELAWRSPGLLSSMKTDPAGGQKLSILAWAGGKANNTHNLLLKRNSQSKQVEKANSGGPTGTSHKSSPSRKKPSPAPTSEHSRAATEDLGSHPRRPAPRRTCSGHARSTAATAPRQEEKSLAGQATPTALESLSDTLHPPRETANDTQRLANNTGPTTGRAANEASNKTFRSTTRAGNSIRKLTAAARRQKTVKETTATGNSHDPPGIHLPAAKKRKVGELAWRSPGLLSSMKTDPAGGQKLSILAWAGGKANNTHNLLLKRNSQSKQVEKANSGGPTGTSHKSSPSRKKPSPAPTSEHSRAATEDLGSHPRRPAPRRTCSGHARSTAATAPRQEEKSLAGQATPTALESLSDTLHPPRETANDTQRLANNTGPTTGRAANEASNKTFRSTTRAGNSIKKLTAAARRQKTVKETTATGNSHDPPGIHLSAAKKRKVGELAWRSPGLLSSMKTDPAGGQKLSILAWAGGKANNTHNLLLKRNSQSKQVEKANSGGPTGTSHKSSPSRKKPSPAPTSEHSRAATEDLGSHPRRPAPRRTCSGHARSTAATAPRQEEKSLAGQATLTALESLSDTLHPPRETANDTQRLANNTGPTTGRAANEASNKTFRSTTRAGNSIRKLTAAARRQKTVKETTATGNSHDPPGIHLPAAKKRKVGELAWRSPGLLSSMKTDPAGGQKLSILAWAGGKANNTHNLLLKRNSQSKQVEKANSGGPTGTSHKSSPSRKKPSPAPTSEHSRAATEDLGSHPRRPAPRRTCSGHARSTAATAPRQEEKSLAGQATPTALESLSDTLHPPRETANDTQRLANNTGPTTGRAANEASNKTFRSTTRAGNSIKKLTAAARRQKTVKETTATGNSHDPPGIHLPAAKKRKVGELAWRSPGLLSSMKTDPAGGQKLSILAWPGGKANNTHNLLLKRNSQSKQVEKANSGGPTGTSHKSSPSRKKPSPAPTSEHSRAATEDLGSHPRRPAPRRTCSGHARSTAATAPRQEEKSLAGQATPTALESLSDTLHPPRETANDTQRLANNTGPTTGRAANEASNKTFRSTTRAGNSIKKLTAAARRQKTVKETTATGNSHDPPGIHLPAAKKRKVGELAWRSPGLLSSMKTDPAGGQKLSILAWPGGKANNTHNLLLKRNSQSKQVEKANSGGPTGTSHKSSPSRKKPSPAPTSEHSRAATEDLGSHPRRPAPRRTCSGHARSTAATAPRQEEKSLAGQATPTALESLSDTLHPPRETANDTQRLANNTGPTTGRAANEASNKTFRSTTRAGNSIKKLTAAARRQKAVKETTATGNSHDPPGIHLPAAKKRKVGELAWRSPGLLSSMKTDPAGGQKLSILAWAGGKANNTHNLLLKRNSQSKQVEKANSGGPTGTSHKSSPSRKKPSPAPTSEHSRAATEDLGSHPRRPAPRGTCSGHARSTAATAPRQEEKSLAGQATPTALESLSDTLHPPRETANDTQRLANNTGPTTGRAANEASNKTFRSTTRAGNSIKKLTAAARRQKTVKETTATGNSHDPPGIHLPAAKKRKVGELAWRSPGLLSSMKTDPAGGQKLSILAWAGGKANNTHNLLLKRNSQSKQVEKANSGGPTGTSHKSSPSRKKPSPAPTSEHSRAATEDLGSHPRRPAPRGTCSGHARSTAATAPRQEEKSLAGQATPTALESLSDTLHPPRETANDTQRLANNTGPTTGRAANEASNKTFRSTTRAGNSIKKLTAAARRQKTVKETTATGNSHDPPGIHLPAAKKRKVGELAWRSPGLLSSMKTDPAGGQKLSILAWAGGKANNTHNLLLKRNSQSKQVEKANSGGPTGTSHKSSPSRKKPSPAPTSEHSRAATEDLGSHPRRPAPRRTCSGHARSTAATAPRQEEKSLAGQATPTALESLSDTLHPPRETANDTQRLANNTGPTTGRAANEASNKTFRSTTRAGNSIKKLTAAARRQKAVKETTATGNSHDPPGIHLPAAKKRKVGELAWRSPGLLSSMKTDPAGGQKLSILAWAGGKANNTHNLLLKRNSQSKQVEKANSGGPTGTSHKSSPSRKKPSPAPTSEHSRAATEDLGSHPRRPAPRGTCSGHARSTAATAPRQEEKSLAGQATPTALESLSDTLHPPRETANDTQRLANNTGPTTGRAANEASNKTFRSTTRAGNSIKKLTAAARRQKTVKETTATGNSHDPPGIHLPAAKKRKVGELAWRSPGLLSSMKTDPAGGQKLSILAWPGGKANNTHNLLLKRNSQSKQVEKANSGGPTGTSHKSSPSRKKPSPAPTSEHSRAATEDLGSHPRRPAPRRTCSGHARSTAATAPRQEEKSLAGQATPTALESLSDTLHPPRETANDTQRLANNTGPTTGRAANEASNKTFRSTTRAGNSIKKLTAAARRQKAVKETTATGNSHDPPGIHLPAAKKRKVGELAWRSPGLLSSMKTDPAGGQKLSILAWAGGKETVKASKWKKPTREDPLGRPTNPPPAERNPRQHQPRSTHGRPRKIWAPIPEGLHHAGHAQDTLGPRLPQHLGRRRKALLDRQRRLLWSLSRTRCILQEKQQTTHNG